MFPKTYGNVFYIKKGVILGREQRLGKTFGLLHQQHVTCALDGFRNMALLLRGQSRNATRQNLAGFRDIAGKDFHIGEVKV